MGFYGLLFNYVVTTWNNSADGLLGEGSSQANTVIKFFSIALPVGGFVTSLALSLLAKQLGPKINLWASTIGVLIFIALCNVPDEATLIVAGTIFSISRVIMYSLHNQIILSLVPLPKYSVMSGIFFSIVGAINLLGMLLVFLGEHVFNKQYLAPNLITGCLAIVIMPFHIRSFLKVLNTVGDAVKASKEKVVDRSDGLRV
eukprot:EC692859.1.p1 GENE.EC692859.1~~EC692859.1.p1  ORF type:complete len:220 (+),score=55.08 EC692859.1:58-660(+)